MDAAKNHEPGTVERLVVEGGGVAGASAGLWLGAGYGGLATAVLAFTAGAAVGVSAGQLAYTLFSRRRPR